MSAALRLVAGRYEVRAMLRTEAAATVYRVLDRLRAKEVGLKAVAGAALAGDPALRKRFTLEAEVGLAGRDGLLRVFDLGEDAPQGLRFYTFELPGGLTLRAWLDAQRRAGRTPTVAQGVEIARQVLGALRVVHEGAVHGGLRPETIHGVGEDPSQIRIEGGAVRIAHGAADAAKASTDAARYLAPECFGGGRVDARADLFAVGVILYEMLTGELPVGFFRPPAQRRPGVSPEVDEAVMRALEADPAARFDSAAAFLEALDGAGGPAPDGEPESMATEDDVVANGADGAADGRSPVVRALPAAVAALAVLVVGLAVWSSFRRAEPPPSGRLPERPAQVEATAPPPAPAPSPAPARVAAPTPPPLPTSPPPVAVASPAGKLVPRPEVAAPRDTDAPAIDLVEPLCGPATNVAAQRLRGRVTDGQLAAVRRDGRPLAVDGNGAFDEPWALREGANETTIEAEDRAGNRSSTRVVVALDRSPPAIEAGFRRLSDDRVVIEVRASEDLGALEVGGDLRSLAPPTRTAEAVVTVPPAGRIFSVGARDLAGNVTTRPLEIRRLPPGVGWLGERLPPGMRRAPAAPACLFAAAPDVELEMVYVPPGSFTMGSDSGQSDAAPAHVHPVREGFYIGRFETTRRQYAAFCRATRRATPQEPGFGTGPDEPVVNVGWDDAKEFCEWAKLRLPTEPEWEKAARGDDRRVYPWGSVFSPERANLCDRACRDDLEWKPAGFSDGFRNLAPVGSFPAGASPFGALDMAGNVWEWCFDAYDPDEYQRYSRGAELPVGVGKIKVARGGACSSHPEGCRTFQRGRFDRYTGSDFLGFRVARDAAAGPDPRR